MEIGGAQCLSGGTHTSQCQGRRVGFCLMPEHVTPNRNWERSVRQIPLGTNGGLTEEMRAGLGNSCEGRWETE